MIENVNK